MPSLLSLPTELLDEIIDLVLHSHKSPTKDLPQDPAPKNERFRKSPPHEINKSYGLLLTNTQLHDQTKLRLKKFSGNYKVDILITATNRVVPIWTFVPSRQDWINTLEITVRFPWWNPRTFRWLDDGVEPSFRNTPPNPHEPLSCIIMNAWYADSRYELVRENSNRNKLDADKLEPFPGFAVEDALLHILHVCTVRSGQNCNTTQSKQHEGGDAYTMTEASDDGLLCRIHWFTRN